MVNNKPDIVATNIYPSSVPSKVWSAAGSASLFVGGYKSAVNLDFLKSENVRLIVNAAPGIENMFPGHKVSAFRCPSIRGPIQLGKKS